MNAFANKYEKWKIRGVFSSYSELHRCHAKVFFDITAKERRIGESYQVANLLDAVIGLLQIITDILKYMIRNPLVSCLARVFLAEGREVF